MQSRQFYAAITATGQLYFDMPKSSRIRAVIFATTPGASVASADYIQFELTTSASTQVAVNDAQGVIAVANFNAGDGFGGGNFHCPCDVTVKAGERVYLNYTEAGTGTWTTRVIVWFD